MDGHLIETRGGKKGQIRPLARFFWCEFSAVRVTSRFAGLEVQEALLRTPFMDIGAGVRIQRVNQGMGHVSRKLALQEFLSSFRYL